jgi:tetratricopeptide (TPR) repeat protein
LIGADQPRGFSEFGKAFREERYRYSLSGCQTLITLVHDYDPVLEPIRRAWLAYHEAKILIDLRHWEDAKKRLNSVLSDDAITPGLRARALFRLGNLHSQQREWDAAVEFFLAALEISENFEEAHDQRHRILDGLATAHRETDDLKEAQRRLNESIALAEAIEDLSALAKSYHSLGALQQKRGDAKAAIESFQKSLEYLTRNNERFRKAQLYSNLGQAYADMADWEESRKYLEESLAIEQEAGDTLGQATAMARIARVDAALGKEAEGFDLVDRSVDLFIQIHDWYGAAIVKRNKARYLRGKRRLEEARKEFDEAIALFGQAKAPKKVEATKEERDALGIKRRLPWYAWIFLLFAALLLALIVALVITGIIITLPE